VRTLAALVTSLWLPAGGTFTSVQPVGGVLIDAAGGHATTVATVREMDTCDALAGEPDGIALCAARSTSSIRRCSTA
jgi:hypothetical protein